MRKLSMSLAMFALIAAPVFTPAAFAQTVTYGPYGRAAYGQGANGGQAYRGPRVQAVQGPNGNTYAQGYRARAFKGTNGTVVNGLNRDYAHSNVTGQSYYRGTYVNGSGSNGTGTINTTNRGSFTCTAYTCTPSGN